MWKREVSPQRKDGEEEGAKDKIDYEDLRYF